jgi:hypothetical protein
MYFGEIISKISGFEDMISILSVCKVVLRKIGTILNEQPLFREYWAFTYPERNNSSSNPYSFMCWRPQPSLTLFGTIALRSPVKFGVWNMRISTRSSPNSWIKGANREAHDGSGVSLVPRSASVRIESFTSLFV